MNFAEMESTQRAALFAALLLASLAAALWCYYDRSGRAQHGRAGLIFLLGLVVSVVLTLPALIASAFSLNDDLLDSLGMIALVGAVAALLFLVGYAVTRTGGVTATESTVVGSTEQRVPSWNEPKAEPTFPGGALSDVTAEATTRLGSADSGAATRVPETRVEPSDDSTRLIRNTPDDLAYIAIRTGPRAGRIHRIEGETNVGRSGESQIALSDDSISRSHARIRRRDGQWTLWDLDSTNGTWIETGTGRERVEAPVPLSDGDRITFGKVETQFLFVRTDHGGKSVV